MTDGCPMCGAKGGDALPRPDGLRESWSDPVRCQGCGTEYVGPVEATGGTVTERAKLLVQVTAGLVPGQPQPELTRTWAWTSGDQEALGRGDKLAKEKYVLIHGESREYAATLEDPARARTG